MKAHEPCLIFSLVGRMATNDGTIKEHFSFGCWNHAAKRNRIHPQRPASHRAGGCGGGGLGSRSNSTSGDPPVKRRVETAG
jgi:hypothetical protein